MRRYAMIALAASALGGCQQVGSPLPESETGDLGVGNDMRKWVDPSTGCAYLIYKNNQGNASVGGFTIRFRADGKPDCPEQVQS